jgi:membrane fusion protein, heavy metal efflux system
MGRAQLEHRLDRLSEMKRNFTIVTTLIIGAAFGGMVSLSPTVRAVFTHPALPGPEKTPRAEQQAVATSTPSGTNPETGKAPEGSINMPPEQIEAQEIEVAAVGKGVLARVLTVPGTITLDPSRVARVPGRVEGTVTQMRKRLGDPVTPGEVVAVLDSREVADAKSEYLTAQVARDLQRTIFERHNALWAQKSNAELQYLQAKESFLEADLRLGLARQKLVALNLDPDDVVNAAKQESGPSTSVSTLREYTIRSLIGGRVIDRKVDVGALVGRQGDPSDLYTIADLSVVWAELAAPTADLETIEEGQKMVILSGREPGKRGEGRIIFVSPLVDPNTRSARVIGELDNKTMIWRPGAAITANIMVKEEHVEVLVPHAAIQTIGGERVLFVRTPNGFEKRVITTGRSDDQAAEVTSGLSAGEEIAVKNSFLLKAELGKGEAAGGED